MRYPLLFILALVSFTTPAVAEVALKEPEPQGGVYEGRVKKLDFVDSRPEATNPLDFTLDVAQGYRMPLVIVSRETKLLRRAGGKDVPCRVGDIKAGCKVRVRPAPTRFPTPARIQASEVVILD